jgi:DNA-directed RNA polymerase subunit L
MMPMNVRPDEVGVIRDTRLELKIGSTPDAPLEVSTDDFTIFGPRKDVILKDRDLGTPGYFLRLAPNQSLHIKATLGVEPKGRSQVCVSTFRNHTEPETLRVQRGLWIDNGKDPREFDSFTYQKFYERDEAGRPYWFDLAVESIGVLPAKDILKQSVETLKEKLMEFMKAPVQREEPGWYRVEMEGETFTLGHLLQELLYRDKNVEYVSRDIGHPLLPKLTVRFSTKQQPEQILETLKRGALELCENVLRSV